MPAKKKASEAVSEVEAPATAELPDNAHSYYVYPHGSDVCAKIFTNEQYKGEAKKFALQYAEEIGGTVQV